MLSSEIVEGSGLFSVAPLIIAFPILGVLINLIFGRRSSERFVGVVASSAIGLAFIVAVTQFIALLGQPEGASVYVADWITYVCRGDLVIAILLIAWSAAILSAIVDNIPFTATMLPVVALLSRTIPGGESGVLWWALALGACFGGNATIVGASANVITTGIAERAGHKITFFQFAKHGIPITIVGMILASAYLVFVLK